MREQKDALEQELAEMRKQPPRITPRKLPDTPRSPSPPHLENILPVHQQPPPPPPPPPPNPNLIYLPNHCPLTLRAVQADSNHLEPFKKQARRMLEEELKDLGLDKVNQLTQSNRIESKSSLCKFDDFVIFV